MLCSLGHDDIQYWLMNPQNRLKLRQLFQIKPFDYTCDVEDFSIEYRFKPQFEPEEFYDALENYRYWKDNYGNYIVKIRTNILYEIKPELKDLGQILRQLRKYIAHTEPDKTVLIYNTSSIPKEIIQQYFESANIAVYQLLPKECKRLEDL